MGHIFIKLILNVLAVGVAAYMIPAVHVEDLVALVVAAVVLAVVNAIVRPILLILTFPVTLVTLGLFLFVINALMVLLAARLVPGFEVDGFWWALAFSLVVSLVSSVLYSMAGERK